MVTRHVSPDFLVIFRCLFKFEFVIFQRLGCNPGISKHQRRRLLFRATQDTLTPLICINVSPPFFWALTFLSTGQEKDVENQCIYVLLGGVNLEYEIVRAQVLSQDPLSVVNSMFALLKR